MKPTLPRPIRIALLPLGVAFGLGAEWTRYVGGWPVPWIVADLVPGIAFLAAGQVVWARRPAVPFGPLLVATGFAWYVGTYSASTDRTIGGLAYAFQGFYDALLAWLVLAYPTGHLRSVSARIAVGAFLGLLVSRAAFRLAVYRPSTEYDFGHPAAVEQYIADFAFRETGDATARVAIAGLAAVIVLLIVRRLARETSVGRRVALPVLVGGVAFAFAIILEVAALATAGDFAARRSAWDLGHAATVLTGALVPLAFMSGIVRSRLDRGSVADLVVELGAVTEQRPLRDLLAETLADPSLEVAYPVPGSDRLIDADGREVDLPDGGDARRAVTRLGPGGATLAVLIHDPALAERPELVRSTIAAARLALDNERLAAEVRRQLQEVRASRERIVTAGDDERRRVERALHDGAQQRLVTLALSLQVARASVDGSRPDLATMLDHATEELQSAMTELRTLARGLHPTALTEDGLAAALEGLADRSPGRVVIQVPEARCPPLVETTAYYVVAEALTNVAKYAEATRTSIVIRNVDGWLRIEVTDDGVGGADPARGSGLRGLEDRVAAAGGHLSIESPSGAGTTIRAQLPCA